MPHDCSSLKPFTDKRHGVVRVVIETPKGSRNKYAFNPKTHIFELSKVLPEGMDFPHDFGFIPSTEAEDGDPLDVLVLMDVPAFPGCLVESRLVAVIEGEQSEGRKMYRNDRLIAVAQESHTHSDIRSLGDINLTLLREVEEFFVSYHKVSGTKFRVLSHGGPRKALKLLTDTLVDAKKRSA